jgi:hypothetical protein
MAASLQVCCLAGAFTGLLSLGAGSILLRCLGRSLKSPIECLCLVIVAVIAGWTFHPYLFDGIIGAGDSYHYTLQVADFVTQSRQGIFPVLVGQSAYAFNGNVHTVRTAPYFTHFAGLLDLLTWRECSFFVLKNLTVLLTAWGAAFAAYAAVRVLAPEMKLAALLVSFLYTTGPGVVAPLVTYDMYATFMTTPWLPLFGLGLVLSLQRLDDGRPLLLTAGALAMIWNAHPPIAAWLSPVFLGVQLLRILLVGGARGNFWRPFVGLAVLAALTGYVFYSVSSLELGYAPSSAATSRINILQHVQADWLQSLQPLDTEAGGNHLQLGYALWAGLMVCLLSVGYTGLAGTFFGGWVISLLAFVFPVPWLNSHLWALVPAPVLVITNIWPAQRFYPILAAAVTVWIALSLGRLTGPLRRRLYPLLCIALLAASAWSACELLKLQHQADKMMLSPGQSALMLRPENLTLTRSSYLMFGSKPAYYTDGWMDPEFESRLLDDDLDVVTTNAGAILTQQALALAAEPSHLLKSPDSLSFDRKKNWLLVFEFGNATVGGELSLSGAISRFYGLPASGGPLAFGSTPGASHTLPVRADPIGSAEIKFKPTVPEVSVKALAFEKDQLPIQLEGLTPYRVRVRATVAGYLETPQMYIPGYQASVNGVTAGVRRSSEELVAVPIPQGESSVIVRYAGPSGLRALWYLCILGFLGLPLLVWRWPPAPEENELNRAAIRQNNLVAVIRRQSRRRLLHGALLLFIIGAVAGGTWLEFNRHRAGSLRLTLFLPRWTTQHAEPLLVTGRTGAADCLYIIYQDAGHIRLGFDHWGVGGPISEPIPVHRGPAHTLEITAGALYHRPDSTYDPFALPKQNAPSALLDVRFDGQVIWHQSARYYPAKPTEVAIGLNPAECSSCEPAFHGEILKVERFIPESQR